MKLTKWSLIALIALAPMLFVPESASARVRGQRKALVQGQKGKTHKHHGHRHHHKHVKAQ